jgi:high-affinity iron transporter
VNQAIGWSNGGKAARAGLNAILIGLGAAILAALVWQGITASGVPDPGAARLSRQAVIVDTALLVFREGLEAILVLAAITASFVGVQASYRRPVAAGAGAAVLASLATWFVAIALLNAVDVPELHLQAATGLLAVVVLLVIMNWFFHKIYWTGWIAHHNRRRRDLLADADGDGMAAQTLFGLALLGFTAIYREGFEIVLFLQNLRLQAGSAVVLQGVAIGLAFTAVVAALTFRLHQRLPYKKMLVLTGVLLGFVLIVMVGESVQEMQLAGWLPTTAVNLPIPDWMGVWFALFPTVESLVAQALAAALVVGSFYAARPVKSALRRA